MDIIKIMEDIAKKYPAKVVICEGWDERCLQAAVDLKKKKLAEPILLGEEKKIRKKAEELKLDIKKIEIHDFQHSNLKKELAEKLVELRKHKGMTKEEAEKLIQDENYFGCLYVCAGYAEAVVGSAICPTAALMKPALQLLRKKDCLVSEIIIFNDVKNQRKIFASDASLNIEPTSEELAQITLNAVESVRDFGIEPKVALLSFSTKGSGGDGPQIQLIRKALEIVKQKDPQLLIDGELQVDAAVNREAAKRKCPDSLLKGEANTIIFPNLTASNICAHALGQFSEVQHEFTVLKGLQKPVGILGRTTPLSSVRNAILSCAMQVAAKK